MKRRISNASEARRKVDRLRALRGSPAQLHEFAMEVLADEGSPELVKLALQSLGEKVGPTDGPCIRDVYAHFNSNGPRLDPTGPVRVEALRALWHLRSGEDMGIALGACNQFEPGFNSNGEVIRAAGLALLGVLDPQRASFAATWMLATGDASEFSGEPALTAVRLLAMQGEATMLLQTAVDPHPRLPSEVRAEAIRSLAGAPEEYIESLLSGLSSSEDEAILLGVADLAAQLGPSPFVRELMANLLDSAPQPEIYEFLASTIVASRREDLIAALVESLPREMSQKRLRSAFEALKLAPKSLAVDSALSELENRLAKQAPPR